MSSSSWVHNSSPRSYHHDPCASSLVPNRCPSSLSLLMSRVRRADDVEMALVPLGRLPSHHLPSPKDSPSASCRALGGKPMLRKALARPNAVPGRCTDLAMLTPLLDRALYLHAPGLLPRNRQRANFRRPGLETCAAGDDVGNPPWLHRRTPSGSDDGKRGGGEGQGPHRGRQRSGRDVQSTWAGCSGGH